MAKSAPVHILLIRSGQTAWEEAGRIQGSTDLPLNEDGKAYAQRAASDLAGSTITTIHHSPDEGSREAAAALARACSGKTKAAPAMGEMELGLWEGLLRSDLEERYPTASKQWKADPSTVNLPEGESTDAAQERLASAVLRALDKAKAGSTVAFVVRPLAFGLLRCWLENEQTSHLWQMVDEDITHKAYDIDKRQLKGPLAPTAAQ